MGYGGNCVQGIMWIPSSGEGEEVAWVAMSWVIEVLLKWDFSTYVSIVGLEEEEPPIVVLAYPMVENHIAWKG
jgi:hypothetical protein